MVTLAPLLRDDWEERLEANIAALHLPKRRADLVRLMVLGLSNREIAAEMELELNSVKNLIYELGSALANRGLPVRIHGATSRGEIVAVMLGVRTDG